MVTPREHYLASKREAYQIQEKKEFYRGQDAVTDRIAVMAKTGYTMTEIYVDLMDNWKWGPVRKESDAFRSGWAEEMWQLEKVMRDKGIALP